jgi:hypothetical protein
MTNGNARVHISLQDGTLEIEGTESFVTEQLTRFEPLIKGAFEYPQRPSPKKPAGNPVSEETSESSDTSAAIEEYSNLYAVADGKVQILKDLPGSNKAQKTVSAALLLSHANGLIGNETTTYDAIRDLCSAHACLDGTNFSKTVKGEKEFFIIGGTSKHQTVKLSVPGRRKAEELAKKLNGE